MKKLIIDLIRTLIIGAWLPAVAFAGVLAVTGSDTSPLNVPVVLMLATAFSSTLAGITTLALRMVRDLKTDANIPHPVLYCASHMLGSWCAGVLFFVISMSQHADVWTLLGTVILASFGGAKVLEKVADAWAGSTK